MSRAGKQPGKIRTESCNQIFAALFGQPAYQRNSEKFLVGQVLVNQYVTLGNFLEVQLTLVRHTLGPRYAKYPSVKAEHERCKVRLNRLGRKPRRCNLRRCAA